LSDKQQLHLSLPLGKELRVLKSEKCEPKSVKSEHLALKGESWYAKRGLVSSEESSYKDHSLITSNTNTTSSSLLAPFFSRSGDETNAHMSSPWRYKRFA